VTGKPPQEAGPPPKAAPGEGSAAGYRTHRQPGAAIPGHRAGRPPAWRPEHDYSPRGPAQLPAWYFELHGQPVPDDAPRTPPPAGFAALMDRRAARPDPDAAGDTGSASAGQDDPSTAAPPPPARPAPPNRRRPAERRPDEPATLAPPRREPCQSPAAAAAPEWCGTCGYQIRPVAARGHQITCLGQA
jgi:hypothetical protein